MLRQARLSLLLFLHLLPLSRGVSNCADAFVKHRAVAKEQKKPPFPIFNHFRVAKQTRNSGGLSEAARNNRQSTTMLEASFPTGLSFMTTGIVTYNDPKIILNAPFLDEEVAKAEEELKQKERQKAKEAMQIV